MDPRRLITMAKEDPTRTIAVAAEIADDTNTEPLMLTVALRARSIAERALGDLEASVSSARNAAAIAEQHQLADQAGMAFATLGASLLQSGGFDEATAAIERGRTLASGHALLQLDMHLAGIHARTGNIGEALTMFDSVIERAEAAGEFELAADALGNQGLVFAHSGQLDQAEQQTRRAQAHFAELAQPVAEAHMTHNLGWLHGLRGDYRQALEAYARAEPQLRGFDFFDDTTRLVDRAEAALNAGLFFEAATDAAAAAVRCRESGSLADEAEAHLITAQAHLARGDEAKALAAASIASELFGSQGRVGWSVEADLVRARCSTGTDAAHLIAVATKLDVAGLGRAARTARLAAAAHGDIEQLELVGPFDELSLAQQALHTLAHVSHLRLVGQPGAALVEIRARLDASADQRRLIEAADVRAGLSAILAELNDLALSIAIEHDDPVTLFEFAEWGSLAFVEPAPVEAPDQPEVAVALADFRTASAALRTAERNFAAVDGLLASSRRAERRLTDVARRRPRARPAELVRPVSLVDLARTLDGRDLSRFCSVVGRLVRVDVTEQRITHSDLGRTSEVRAVVDELLRHLERSMVDLGSARLNSLVVDEAQMAARRLDALLFAGKTADSDAPERVIVPGPMLGDVPWMMLPSCRRGHTMITPTAGLVSSRKSTSMPTRFIGIAGPALQNAPAEVALIAELYPDASTAIADAATVEHSLNTMAGADVVHIAAHGHLRPDQPLLSSVELADGSLTLIDFHRLLPAPEIVVLASCSSGSAARPRAADLIGAASVLLNAGSRFVIGCPVALPDEHVTTTVMTQLHSLLASGEPVPAAIETTIERLGGRAQRIALALVVFGSG